MLAALALLKSKVFWASLILVAFATLTGYFWISNNHLEAQVSKLTGQIDTAQVVITQKTAAAQTCSDQTAALKAQETNLASEVAVAQAAASSAAAVHTKKEQAILSAKPASGVSDSDATNALLNSLIGH
jgi:peptidoglycan hydrolase CwlO-like protein